MPLPKYLVLMLKIYALMHFIGLIKVQSGKEFYKNSAHSVIWNKVK